MVKNNYSGPVNACITMSAKRGRCEEDELSDYTICSMTMDQLPKTLFKQGTETQVEKVNNTCRTSILKTLKYSGRVIHSFVCKQLLTAKHHELWFHFARRALGFSMQEFHAITGLKYKDDEPDLDIDNWRGDKWLRMVYLCVIAGLVMAKDEKVCIPHKYIKLVMDFDKMRKFLSGLHSFDALVTTITEARDKVKTQNSYGVVSPYISSTENGNIIVDAGFERDNEMNDERVDLIIDMYRKKYEWSKHVWGYQENVQPYAYSSEEDGSKEEEAGETSDCGIEEEIETAHVSPAKKRKNQYQDIGAESRKRLVFRLILGLMVLLRLILLLQLLLRHLLNDYGAYSLKFIECHLLGLDFSLVNDENIQEARHKIAFDLWEAANDEALQYRMSTFKPPKRAPEKTVELF
ncbi:unnamed protein product [Brassica oleracea]|uniref:(rape) hypothetical protein n=1 Tax=Brassica napus TaxID=3708 RepID=A0A816Q804_BRANA|nr:unnamed protein product [Brassica napus]